MYAFLFASAAILAFAWQCAAASPLTLDSSIPSVDPWKHMEYFLDPEARLDVALAASPRVSQRFLKTTPEQRALGPTYGTIWLRLRLDPGRDGRGLWLFQAPWPHSAGARLYARKTGPGLAGEWREVRQGYYTRAGGSGQGQWQPVFALSLRSGEPLDLYLQVKGGGLAMGRPQIYSEQAFLAESLADRAHDAVFLGFLAALALTNLFLFFFLRDYSYVWYAFYVFSVGCYLAGAAGMDMWGPLEARPGLSRTLNLVFLALSLGCFALFTRCFFETKIRARVSHILLGAAAGMSLTCSVCAAFIRWELLSGVVIVCCVALMAVALPNAVICLMRGFLPARFYLLGSFAFALGGGAYLWMRMGLPLLFDLGHQAFKWGLAAQALFLALALGDRIRILNQERQEARLASQVKGRLLTATRESRQRLANIIDLLPEATFVVDGQKRVIAWNLAAEELTGVKAAEMLGKCDQQYAVPFYGHPRPLLIDLALDPDTDLKDFYSRLEHRGDMIIGESEVREVNGSVRFLYATARPLRDSQGAPAGAVETVQDITEKKWTEQAVSRALESQRAVFNAVDDALFVLEKGGRVVDVNQKALTMFGLTRGQALLMALPDDLTLGGASESGDIQPWDGVAEGQKRFFRWRAKRLDAKGEPLETEVMLSRVSLQQGSVVLAHVRDITIRRRAEEARRLSDHRLMDIINHLPEATFVVDHHGRVAAWNRAMESLTGVKASKMLGKGDHRYAVPFYGEPRPMLVDLVNSPDPRFERQYRRLERSGGALHAESHHPHMGDVYLAGTARPLLDSAGRVVGAVESIRDITNPTKVGLALKADRDELEQRVAERTAELVAINQQLMAEIRERKQAEQARRQAEERLEEQRTLTIRNDRLSSLGQMAAGIAHELNQPLLGVRGLSEHLLLGIGRGWDMDSGKVREKLEMIMGQADRMSHIIEHVRMFAKGAGKNATEPVNLSEVVRSALGALGAQMGSQGIEIVQKLGDSLPLVEANPYSLEEVVINLIINARDAVEQMRREHPGQAASRVELTTSADDKHVRLEVRDWGVGIAPEVMPKIFDAFMTTKGPEKGTGLGLAISRSIVEQFGGRIEMDSAPGKGATASVWLPRADDNTQ